MPLISVVLPTRNRSQLLAGAIRSVLGQTLGDLELIVSDNFSDDDTASVVRHFSDQRINYFRTERALSVSDSYHSALQHATGEYISFISDDDAYTPVLLERAMDAIELADSESVTFRFAGYYHDGDHVFNRRVPPETLVFPAFTGNITEFAPNDAQQQVFRRYGVTRGSIDPNFYVSFLSNTVAHRSVFERVRNYKNNLFECVPADVYLSGALTYAVKKYCCLDLPLYTWANWSDNLTASPSKVKNGLRTRFESMLGGRTLEHAPLKFALPDNCVADALQQVRVDMETRAPTIDRVAYFIHMHQYLDELAAKGVDVTEEKEEFRTVLQTEPSAVREAVGHEFASVSFRSKQLVRKFQPLVRLAKMVFRTPGERQIMVDGRAQGFENVLDAANYLGARIASGRY